MQRVRAYIRRRSRTEIVVALKRFTEDGIVRLLGHRAFPTGVERRQVPFDHLDEPVARRVMIGDTEAEWQCSPTLIAVLGLLDELIGMRKKIR